MARVVYHVESKSLLVAKRLMMHVQEYQWMKVLVVELVSIGILVSEFRIELIPLHLHQDGIDLRGSDVMGQHRQNGILVVRLTLVFPNSTET